MASSIINSITGQNRKPMFHISTSRLVAMTVSAIAIISANAHAQQVALLDSGIDPDAGYNVVQGFNYFLNSSDTSDVSDREGEGHGTVSARLVTEAFSGEIVPFVITDGQSLQLFEDQVRAARDSALSDILGRDDVRVIGITRATPGVAGSAAPLLPQLSDANKVIVIMAGNNVSSQPSVLATGSFNLRGVIIVGATDADGVLLPESNRAGTTQNRYVAANGLPSSDAALGGSSWAAARISGIAGAVLMQNPNLTAEEVVDIIFRSTEDRGAVGIDAEYGRGVILNAAQVLNNAIGPTVVPVDPITPPNNSGGGGGAGLLLGGAVAAALLLLRKPKAKLEKTLVLDSYGRAFQIDLGDHIEVSDGRLHLDDFFHGLSQTSVGNQFLLPELNTMVAFGASTNDDHRFDMIEYFGMPGDVVLENQQAEVSVAMRSKLTSQIDLSTGYRVSPHQTYGAVSQLDSHELFGSSSFISGQAFSSVLSGFGAQAQTASLNYHPKKFRNASLKFGLASVDQKQDFGLDSMSSILQAGYQFNDNGGLSMQFGQIEENGSLFGGAAGGVFGVETATTYAVNLSGNIKASENVSIVANYGMGRTHVDASENSLLKDFSSLSSDWYSLGIVGNNVFRATDQVGFAMSQPLKIRSGGVDYSIPNSRKFNGDIGFDRERINLSDTGATERNVEAYYRTMLSDKMEFGGFISFRQNPNHVSENGDDLLLMATLRYRQ
jgi:hypothetical protein